MMKIQEGYFYMNGSCLVTEYHSYGTLLVRVSALIILTLNWR